MTAAVLIARPVPAPPPAAADINDPQRTALAETLARVSVAEAAMAAHRKAVARAEALVEAADERLVVAQTNIAKAKDDYATAIASDAADRVASAAASLRQARAEETEIRDEIEAARAATAALQERTGNFAVDIELAKIAMLGARAAITAPVAQKFIAELAELRQRTATLRSIIGALVADDGYVGASDDLSIINKTGELRGATVAIRRQFEDALAKTITLGGPLAAQWAQWRRDLLSNPNAVPPEET